jgi:hypothetical protein
MAMAGGLGYWVGIRYQCIFPDPVRHAFARNPRNEINGEFDSTDENRMWDGGKRLGISRA